MQSVLLAEILRGGRVESSHSGAFVVADGDGRVVASGGDFERGVYPRSANKVMQALPLVLDGAAARFELSVAELALACASHVGSALHAGVARGMLQKAGRSVGCLECGVQWPAGGAAGDEAARALAAAGEAPSALHNNCSGKHAGFVCSAVAAGVDPAGYVAGDHPVMVAVTRAVGEVMAVRLDLAPRAVDGCSIPTFAVPLSALARGFARIGTGLGLPEGFGEAARVLRRAVAAHPVMVAGEGMFDTMIATYLGEAVFLKGGAEGVCCGAVPGLGVGFAIKCDDGARRGAEAAAASLLRGLLGPHPALDHFSTLVLRNWNGIEVGKVRGTLG